MAPMMSYTETLETTTCWCGIRLAVPTNLLKWAREDNAHSIYCPLGHTFVFGNSFREKLRQEEERRVAAERRAQANRDLLEAEERSHAATRGHLTRTKTRVAGGVCPCCNRTFVKLGQHMATKHPEYAEKGPTRESTPSSDAPRKDSHRTPKLAPGQVVCKILGCANVANQRGRYAYLCSEHRGKYGS